MCVCLYIYECIITFPGRAEMREHDRTMELVLEDWWSPSCSPRNAQMSPHTQRPVQIGGTLFGWSLRTIKIVLVGKRLLWVILYVVRTWCEHLRAPRGFACDYIILGGKGVWVGGVVSSRWLGGFQKSGVFVEGNIYMDHDVCWRHKLSWMHSISKVRWTLINLKMQ